MVVTEDNRSTQNSESIANAVTFTSVYALRPRDIVIGCQYGCEGQPPSAWSEPHHSASILFLHPCDSYSLSWGLQIAAGTSHHIPERQVVAYPSIYRRAES